ncbi:hypothetical protein TNIN_353921 [Trichonephila inaurata madagascariensis]|uniref:Uncharacterized protein n=1 Tax=Trichonephila inaurata madagascariensis TaxID=2747483 RepID=A0A8X6XMT9_9ARAC|nr:hypothetical protein TNIN_353921 [Trichonephila inaurata madagascariensis]
MWSCPHLPSHASGQLLPTWQSRVPPESTGSRTLRGPFLNSPPTPQVPCQPSLDETSVARLPGSPQDVSAPCGVKTEDENILVSCMSCTVHSSLTVDQLDWL